MKLALALTLLAGWQPVQPMAPVGLAGAGTSVGADGTVHAVSSPLDGPLELRSAPPGGAFGPPRALLSGVRLVYADVDATGAATAVYDAAQPGDVGPAGDAPATRSVVAAVASLGQPLGPAALVSSAGRRARAWDVDVAENGAAVAGWLQHSGRHWHVFAAVRPPGAAVFGPPVSVSGPVLQREVVDVAAGERGDALVAWSSRAYGTTGAHVALARPDGRFARPVTVSPRAGAVHMAIGSDGTAVVGVEHRRAFNVRAFVAARREPTLRSFQTLRCPQSQAAAAADGRVLVACSRGDELWTWEGRRALRRTARLTAKPLSFDGDRVRTELGRGGRAVVAWEERSGQVRASYRSRPGAFEAPVALTPRGEDGSVVAAHLLSGGGALVLADRFDGTRRATVGARYAP